MSYYVDESDEDPYASIDAENGVEKGFEVAEGLAPEKDPTRKGFCFDGWEAVEGLNKDGKVTGEVKFVAKWREHSPHTPGTPVRENEVEATCAQSGSHDEVTYCSVCGEELSRETVTDTVPHTPAPAVEENRVEATCTAEGSYDEVIYCKDCYHEINRKTETIAKLDHTPGTPVEENRVAPQVGVSGSYDEVIYCDICHEQLSRETHIIPALPEPPAIVLPDDGTGDDAGGEAEISDPLVPLASGPITRAQFIDYLWRHEGELASNGVCTFTDVPESHKYVLALAWAEQNGIAEAYDDGTFEPDELVTVGAAREFLTNFEAVFGKQTVAASALTTLTGADDEAVLNCDEVLAEFFGEEYVSAKIEDDIAA